MPTPDNKRECEKECKCTCKFCQNGNHDYHSKCHASPGLDKKRKCPVCKTTDLFDGDYCLEDGVFTADPFLTKTLAEFDLCFGRKGTRTESLNWEESAEQIKSFLRSALNTQREEAYKKGEQDEKNRFSSSYLFQAFIDPYVNKKVEEAREEVREKVENLRHEIQQDKMPIGNEQWKEGHTKCLNEVLALLSPNNKENE